MVHYDDNCETCSAIELGAISLKFTQRLVTGESQSEIIRHEGNPGKAVKSILDKYSPPPGSPIVITGETAKALLNFPYFSEKCICNI